MRPKHLPRTVIVLGTASFFTDFSSEMIYPLLPVFLTTVLAAGALQIGLIEGVAESTASLLKIVSGVWTDRVGRRKPFVVGGYSMTSLVRPFIGLAAAWPVVLVLRFIDRMGKGIRTSPRDALITDVTPKEQRGTAFGFHRAMDHAGAVAGPLAAAGLLAWGHFSLRNVFFCAAFPAAVVIVLVMTKLKEDRPHSHPKSSNSLKGSWKEFGAPFKFFLGVLLVFALGNSTDAFLLLRLNQAQLPIYGVSLLWALHHIVKMTSTYWGGLWADRIHRQLMIMAGWILHALVYLGFALIGTRSVLTLIFLIYGIYYGLTEPAEKALIADFAPAHLRGTAFSYYNGVIGLAALPASVLFGFLWAHWGAPQAFLTGAALAATSSIGLAFLGRES